MNEGDVDREDRKVLYPIFPSPPEENLLGGFFD
jgi:hypothetical protein